MIPIRPTPRRVPFPLHDEEGSVTHYRSNDHTSSSWTNAMLPPDHFLARRPAEPHSPIASTSTRTATAHQDDYQRWQQNARPDTSSLAAADYDVAISTGFLPPQEPIQKLRIGAGWDQFENVLELAQSEVKRLQGAAIGRMSQDWRLQVEQLPTPSITALYSLPLLRRAHVLLSYLGHFYVHSIHPYDTRVPSSISIPWVRVSQALGLPPILTYADTVLWNWHLIDASLGIRADNMAITTAFTSSSSEKAFFFLSLLCELHGPTILRLMSSTLDECFFADQVALKRIALHLETISNSINDLTFLLSEATKGPFGPASVRTLIDPSTFYWEIRPWFNGGKWVYEGVGEFEYGGPSAGQSSLIHSIDLFLGIDHSPRSSTSNVINSNKSSSEVMNPDAPLPPKPIRKELSDDETFMSRMSTYMPLHHRSFLNHLIELSDDSNVDSIPSIRSLVHLHPQLHTPYDRTVRAIKSFRDEHMKLATVFIVSQARKEPRSNTVFWHEWNLKRIEKEFELAEKKRLGVGEETKKDVMKGTGGTDLVVFLKMCRDRTKEAIIGE